MNRYAVEKLTDENEKAWSHFNETHEYGSIFHTIEWKNIFTESLNVPDHYFIVSDEKGIAALCPFMEDTIKMFRGMVTLPHADYSHILFRERMIDPVLVQTILDHCRIIAKARNLSYIHITTFLDMLPELPDVQYLLYPRHCTMKIALEQSPPEYIWNTVFHNSLRRKVNAFKKDGFVLEEANTPEGIKTFYETYQSNSTNQQFIVHPLHHFQRLGDAFLPDRMKILLLSKDEVQYGSLLFFLFPPQKTAYFVYVGINREAMKQLPKVYHVSLGLHWEAIQRLYAWGYKGICLGKTPDDPTNLYYHQKENLGGQVEYSNHVLVPTSPIFATVYKTFSRIKGRGV
jgi:lipid II:glycine glycyltransferase (peptidoglycan interpeptide bridge formation enzyme)